MKNVQLLVVASSICGATKRPSVENDTHNLTVSSSLTRVLAGAGTNFNNGTVAIARFGSLTLHS